jgi:hypothetical protein
VQIRPAANLFKEQAMSEPTVEPAKRIEGCEHSAVRMAHWASEGACPICLTAECGMANDNLARAKEEIQGLTTQLAEAKAALRGALFQLGEVRIAEGTSEEGTIGGNIAIMAEQRDKIAELQAALDREREARLRAEAGVAQLRFAYQGAVVGGQFGHTWGCTCEHPQCVSRAKALSTDTGARLAAVLSEVVKMPCEKQIWAITGSRGPCSEYWHRDNFDKWCLRCRLVDAMEGKP